MYTYTTECIYYIYAIYLSTHTNARLAPLWAFCCPRNAFVLSQTTLDAAHPPGANVKNDTITSKKYQDLVQHLRIYFLKKIHVFILRGEKTHPLQNPPKPPTICHHPTDLVLGSRADPGRPNDVRLRPNATLPGTHGSTGSVYLKPLDHPEALGV